MSINIRHKNAVNKIKELTIIVTHFYDFTWTELLIQKIQQLTEENSLREILVINQDRNEESLKRLQHLDSRIRVLQYPKSTEHFDITGHDHAAVLNKAVLEVRGEYLCIFDSDAHPIDKSWLYRCEQLLEHYDAILAQAPGLPNLSHPCFMLLKSEHVLIPLSFDEHLSEGMDTGRLIGTQLSKAGEKVFFAYPERAFSGLYGYIYLDSIYHHGSGTFQGGGHLLRKQVTSANNFFRKKVVCSHKYDLSLLERMALKALLTIKRSFLSVKAKL